MIRELREDLRSQAAEDREAELGRPLNQNEQEQILKQWGHPWLLASRYQPQRQLVGSALFPFYWLTLKVALGIALLVHVIAAAVLLANGRPLDDALSRLARLEPFLMAFAWVTLTFAILDRTVLRLPLFARWHPSSLPVVPKESGASSMSWRIAEIVMTAVFLLLAGCRAAQSMARLRARVDDDRAWTAVVRRSCADAGADRRGARGHGDWSPPS